MQGYQKYSKALIVVLFLFAIAIFATILSSADLPSQDSGVASLMPLLSSASAAKMMDTLWAECDLRAIEAGSSAAQRNPRILAVYAVESSPGYFYYYAIICSKNATRGVSGVSDISVTTEFSLTSAGNCTQYCWDNRDNGGWLTLNTTSGSLSSTISCSYVLFYSSGNLGSNEVKHNLYANAPTTQLTGSGTVGSCADSWILARNLKRDGVNGAGLYTATQYNNAYNSGFSDGQDSTYSSAYQAGIEFVQNHPNRYDLYTSSDLLSEYNRGFSDGLDASGTTPDKVIYDLDIASVVDATFDGIGGILSFADFEIFGVNVLGLLMLLCVIAILVFCIKLFAFK